MWDFLRNGRTGDWEFSGNGDLAGISGPRLTQQRVQINMKIPRGTFIYDIEKTLGSRLYDIIRHDIERGMRDAPDVIREALENMDDISIEEIQITQNEDRILATIKYRIVTPVDVTESLLDTSILEIPIEINPSGTTQTHFAEG